MEPNGEGITTRIFTTLVLGLCLCAFTARSATVITNNIALSAVNSSYDGLDLVISNCAVTVDGSHSFNSLYVGAGGVLTHSFWPTGTATPLVNVTNEVQVL